MLIPTGKPEAAACIQGDRALRGTVKFYALGECTLVVADIQGLPSNSTGFYGFHIHEGDSCLGETFPNTGGHYNPYSAAHPQHPGDLPPLLSQNGTAFLAVRTGRFRIRDIIGRTVVIHSDADDFRSQPAGNAGRKIACGVIRKL